jgi:hypothetical protein
VAGNIVARSRFPFGSRTMIWRREMPRAHFVADAVKKLRLFAHQPKRPSEKSPAQQLLQDLEKPAG